MRAARSKSIRLSKKVYDQARNGYATQGPKGPAHPSSSNTPPAPAPPPPRPAEKFAKPESAAPTASPPPGNPQPSRGVSPLWWLGGLAAVGALYAVNVSLPQQQVAHTKQTADEFEISPGQHALQQEEPGPLSSTPQEPLAPHDAPTADQETSSVTGQPLGPHEVFTDQEGQDQAAQARSHSTFHEDELAMTSSHGGSHGQPSTEHDPQHTASGGHRRHDPSSHRDHIVMTDGSILSSLSSVLRPDSHEGGSQQSPHETSQHASSDATNGSSSSKGTQSPAAGVDVHGLDRAHDSGIEAAVSVDPTPMTDLLNEALTGEMLHPEHPGHEHTTLDDPPRAHESSSGHTGEAEPSSRAASDQGYEASDARADADNESREDGGGEDKPKRQWVPPIWSRLPETGALLRGGPAGPDEAEQQEMEELAEESEAIRQHIALACQQLGIHEDLTPNGLLSHAEAMQHFDGRHWHSLRAQHRQAQSDARVLADALQQALSTHQEEMELAQDQGRRDGDQWREQLEDARQDFKAIVQEATDRRRQRDRDHEQELSQLQQQMSQEAADAAEMERVQRHEALDEVRLKLDALQQAFDQRSSERQISHAAHAVSAHTFELESALASGRPFQQELASLKQVASEDPLLQAILRSLPSNFAVQGLDTRAELQARWPGVARSARRNGYMEPGKAGFLSTALARIATALKMNEAGLPLSDSAPEGRQEQPSKSANIDASLARAEEALVAGDLSAAADRLEDAVKGTAAAVLIGPWARSARGRAAVELSTALLQTHAAALAASLS
ncbi:hypothetical protein WJX74_002399 [Apatococcus lobatus]|uniref:Uncharacterized protein n=1 Tax=Apatococcus lobatus TaxID=904363 RepID=A0AAW1R261_9CHLO